MNLEDLPHGQLLQMGRAHFLCIVMTEVCEKLYKDFPSDIGTDIKAINQRLIYELAKSIEERRGEPERDAFLEEISKVAQPFQPKKAKPAPKPKKAVK